MNTLSKPKTPICRYPTKQRFFSSTSSNIHYSTAYTASASYHSTQGIDTSRHTYGRTLCSRFTNMQFSQSDSTPPLPSLLTNKSTALRALGKTRVHGMDQHTAHAPDKRRYRRSRMTLLHTPHNTLSLSNPSLICFIL